MRKTSQMLLPNLTEKRSNGSGTVMAQWALKPLRMIKQAVLINTLESTV
jgi:hypothetical protein